MRVRAVKRRVECPEISLNVISGGYSGFQVMGMIKWSQKSRPKKIPRAPAKPKKSLYQKLTSKISHADFLALQSSKKMVML